MKVKPTVGDDLGYGRTTLSGSVMMMAVMVVVVVLEVVVVRTGDL